MTQTHGDATVDGRLLRAVLDGVRESTGHFEDRTRRMLADNDLDPDPQPGTAYPFGSFLDLLEQVRREAGPNTLDRIGRAAARSLTWTDDVDTVTDALDALETTVGRHHEGVTLRCSFVATALHAGRVDVETPYPEAFERGLLEGISKRFGYGPGHLTVQRTAVRTDGGRGRTLDLAWSVDPAAETAIPAPSAD